MAYKIPWSNFHELNLDWLLQQVKELREEVDGLIGSATPSDATPEMDGAGTPGASVTYSRGDHQHPTDTSRAAQSDLTQEITDRGNADLALASDIADVDAKIKFSTAAPIMDSSSASAGFSDYMARADHIHPTDTSRASATDLAVLQARVDGFTGSANPSDTTPLMDGVGAAGTGGNYSRGDHVHPSDTSKLDIAGGTMTGYLHQAKLETHAQLTANGWYRIATIPQVAGTLVCIRIAKYGAATPSEVHIINLDILLNTILFSGEESHCDAKYIDSIRYTTAGAVDIHLDQNYTVDIGVMISPLAGTEAAQDAIYVRNFAPVAAAPLGETIIAEYDFNANTGTYLTESLTGDTLGAQTSTTLKSISIPKGMRRIRGFVRIRTASMVNKILLQVTGDDNFYTTIVTADYMGFAYDIAVTPGNTVNVTAYLYDSTPNSIQSGSLYYEFS